MSTWILVVDDEAVSARFIGEVIGEWGFEVVTASNGREGLNVLRTMRVNGILLDLEMPVMNGWTMLDELRWQGCQVPVIVMAHEVNYGNLKKILVEGAHDYLVKPLDRQLLLQKLFRHFLWQTANEKSLVLLKERTRPVSMKKKDLLAPKMNF